MLHRESCLCHHVPVYLYEAVRMNSFFFSSISLLFGFSFDLFQLIETVLLKSTNFESIGDSLHRVHRFQRNGYRLIYTRLQIKAKFTTFKSI